MDEDSTAPCTLEMSVEEVSLAVDASMVDNEGAVEELLVDTDSVVGAEAISDADG